MPGCDFGDGNRVLGVGFSVLDREGYRRFVFLGMSGGVAWCRIYRVKAKSLDQLLTPVHVAVFGPTFCQGNP